MPDSIAYAPYEGIASDRKTDVRWQKRTHSRICFIIFNSQTDIIYTKIIIFVHSEHSVRLAISTASAPRQAYERKRKTETETYNPKQP